MKFLGQVSDVNIDNSTKCIKLQCPECACAENMPFERLCGKVRSCPTYHYSERVIVRYIMFISPEYFLFTILTGEQSGSSLVPPIKLSDKEA